MEAPKCKICGERHYGACLHFSGKENEQWPKEVIESETAKAVAAIQPNRLPKFDKVAYQRDYMRKRRAAAKALNQKP